MTSLRVKPVAPLRSVQSVSVSEKCGSALNPHYFWHTWEFTLALDCGHTQVRARYGHDSVDAPSPESLRPPLPKKVRCKQCPSQRSRATEREPKFDRLVAALVASMCLAVPSERSALLSWAATNAGHIGNDAVRARARGALALVGIDALLTAGAREKIGSRVRSAVARWADDPTDDRRDDVRRAARQLSSNIRGGGEGLIDEGIVQAAFVVSPFPHDARGVFGCVAAIGAGVPMQSGTLRGLLANGGKLTAAEEDSVWGELREALGDDFVRLDESHAPQVAAMLAAYFDAAPGYGVDVERLADMRRLLRKSERSAHRAHLRERIARSRSGPLDDEEWSTAVDGVRRCYELAGLPWHNNVARVSSPLAGALVAAFASDWLIGKETDGQQSAVLLMSKAPNEISALGPEVVEKAQSLVSASATVPWRGYSAYSDRLRVARPLKPFQKLTRAVDAAVSGAFAAGAAADELLIASDAEAELIRQAVEMNLDRLRNPDSGVDYKMTPAIRATWWNHRGFQLGGLAPAHLAHQEFALAILGGDLSPLVRRKAEALHAAATGGPWWAYRDFAVICDRPIAVRPNHVSSRPFMRWSDGWEVYRHRGIAVPRWVVTRPTVKSAFAERNSEIRRLALEQIGWPRVLDELGEPPLDRCPDPGNPGAELLLYKLPREINPFSTGVRVLVMTNGSPDRDGGKRVYGETVPADVGSAIEAAAWQYGVPVAVYRELARRT